MGIQGRPPKDPDKRARANKDTAVHTYVEADADPQPPLPRLRDEYGDIYEWPEITVEWWERWGRSPLATRFTAADWDEMVVAARLHAKFWETGSHNVAAELRSRMAKFGATPEDRAKLRIHFVMAEDSERKSANQRKYESDEDQKRQQDVKNRYGTLRLVE